MRRPCASCLLSAPLLMLMLAGGGLSVAASACGGADGGGPGGTASSVSGDEGGADDARGVDPAPEAGGGAQPAPDAGADGSTPPPPPPPPPPKFDVTTETITVFGASRTFVLVTPRNYDATKAYPFVMNFHGDGGNGAGHRAAYPIESYSGYDAFVAYPDAKAGASWDLYTPLASNADDAFVLAIVDAVKARANIDLARVFGTGHSAGAFFANQLACRKPTLFRAIVSNAGGAPDEPTDPAASKWPNGFTKCAGQTSGVSAMVIHGTDDGVVTEASGNFSARYWAYVNGCNDDVKARMATTPAPCLAHASCPAGKLVSYCPVPGIGHGIWSEAVRESWSFFRSF